MTIVILGGYGGVARRLVKQLLDHTPHRLVVAGRNLPKAREFAHSLHTDRVSAVYADAAQPDSLNIAFAGAHLLIVAAPVAPFIGHVISAALTNGCDWLDMLLEKPVLESLQKEADHIQQSGRLFITQAGYHPGMPAILMRQMADNFDATQEIHIGFAQEARFESPESTTELLHEIGKGHSAVWENGFWRKAGWRDLRSFRFYEHFGNRSCYPLQLEEVAIAANDLHLKKAGIYAAGFNWLCDYVAMPIMLLLYPFRQTHGFLKWLLYWSINVLYKSDALEMLAEAKGIKNGQENKSILHLTHDDAYNFTAICIMACLEQYFGGQLPRAGLHFMGLVTHPLQALEAMQRMGVKLNYANH